MIRYRLHNLIAIPFVVLAFLMNIIHPFIHGTFLDGGAWDSALANIDMIAAYFSGNRGV